MGEARVSRLTDSRTKKKFVRSLLNDVEALEHMLDNGWFEDDVVKIGAEQEMCIVDKESLKPRPISMEILESMGEQNWAETELAQFNLETGMMPRDFSGSCLRDMEDEILGMMKELRQVFSKFNAAPLLTGILPTLRRHFLDMKYLTPLKRYKALMDALNDHRMGKTFELRLNGIDELTLKHDSPMLEACNTSFQVHLQVSPQNFANQYNIAQLLAAPIISAASNSPIVFGRRLWHESRIALFQQSIDTRTSHEHLRERLPRVNFGNAWMDNSVIEIYKEDIARFRVLLSADVEENSMEAITNNKVPNLRALQVHNGTVYRWNRGCYGISDSGKPHLRIENRVLASGPTVVDEMANAALWLGAVIGYHNSDIKVEESLSFAAARDNFGKAAKYGLETKFNWLHNKKYSATDLLTQEIIPMAREGLKSRNVDTADIDKYMDILKERSSSHRNGASWLLRNYSNLLEHVSVDEAVTALTSKMLDNQVTETPVHKWEDADESNLTDYKMSELKVEDFMDTDVFSVHQDDIVELVSEMMEWNQFRYVPVENKNGDLVGLITGRILLRHYMKMVKSRSRKSFLVKEVMIKEPITISPDQTVMEAMDVMKEKKVGCLPVVKNNELIGIVSEANFLRVTHRLIGRIEDQDKD